MNKYFDHTLLKAFATQKDIEKLCDEALELNTASVCVNPKWISFCKEKLKDSDVKVCTVIGFPLGADGLDIKSSACKQALENGADEIDYVIDIGAARMHDWKQIRKEMLIITEICHNQHKCVKVIFENCYLNKNEIKELSLIASDIQPDYIKTSTGFGTNGAKLDDVLWMKKYAGDKVKIKAAGGIHTWKECKEFIEAGASRIGASATINILNEYKMEE